MKMKHLNKPKFDVCEIVTECASSYRDNDLKKRLTGSSIAIAKESAYYDELGTNLELNAIKPKNFIKGTNGTVIDSELKDLYTSKFAKRNDLKEKYYDKIILSAINGKCPICGIGQVSNLDHYLAKSVFPIYSVTPYNLLPICRDCNTNKKETIATNKNELPLHPYYDNIDNYIWLKAKLKQDKELFIANYYIDENLKILDETLYFRLLHHMDLYKLYQAYSVEAATELAENNSMWEKNYKEWEKDKFTIHMKDCLTSYESLQKNTWKTALYRAIIEKLTT